MYGITSPKKAIYSPMTVVNNCCHVDIFICTKTGWIQDFTKGCQAKRAGNVLFLARLESAYSLNERV